MYLLPSFKVHIPSQSFLHRRPFIVQIDPGDRSLNKRKQIKLCGWSKGRLWESHSPGAMHISVLSIPLSNLKCVSEHAQLQFFRLGDPWWWHLMSFLPPRQKANWGKTSLPQEARELSTSRSEQSIWAHCWASPNATARLPFNSRGRLFAWVESHFSF